MDEDLRRLIDEGLREVIGRSQQRLKGGEGVLMWGSWRWK
jgi:hypothetical protein